jgi:hypothetical protein
MSYYSGSATYMACHNNQELLVPENFRLTAITIMMGEILNRKNRNQKEKAGLQHIVAKMSLCIN